mmetsp:Transcript_38027/g.59304  ORF Transcript_38027/g.59304 Transcript_38027/m.59304 type:complete len:95 (-) Transcript_38027:651-935(-)
MAESSFRKKMTVASAALPLKAASPPISPLHFADFFSSKRGKERIFVRGRDQRALTVSPKSNFSPLTLAGWMARGGETVEGLFLVVLNERCFLSL